MTDPKDGWPINFRTVRARLELDRNQIVGLNMAASLMRKHAGAHEQEAQALVTQRDSLILLLSRRARKSGELDELRSLLKEFGLEPTDPKDEGASS